MRPEKFSNFKRNISIYALYFDKISLSYTYIPKNACSTLKLSLAVANGSLVPHDNPHGKEAKFITHSFAPHLRVHKFVVLRDPFQRLVSAYLDKICVSQLQNFAADEIVNIFCYVRGVPENVAVELYKEGLRPSFSEFVAYVSKKGDEEINEHWRSQCSFFSFEEYDSIIKFEDIGMEINFPGHITVKLLDNYKNMAKERGVIVITPNKFVSSGSISHIPGDILLGKILSDRVIPHFSLFFTDKELIESVQIRYADDILAYINYFDGMGRNELFSTWL